MAKANQKANWEASGSKTDPPSKRTEGKGIKNKYSGKPHNHFPLGKTGYVPRGS